MEVEADIAYLKFKKIFFVVLGCVLPAILSKWTKEAYFAQFLIKIALFWNI